MHWRNPLAFSLCYDAISYKSNSYMSPQPQTRKGSADKQKRSLHTYFCSKGEVRIFMLFSFSYLWNGRKDYCVWSKDQDLLWLWKSYLFIPFCIAFFFCGEKSCQDLLSDCINFRTFQSKNEYKFKKTYFQVDSLLVTIVKSEWLFISNHHSSKAKWLKFNILSHYSIFSLIWRRSF